MANTTKTVADLAPNPRNPRKITDAKLKMLAKAMDKFGDLGGVVFNTRSGQLIGGHQRTKALPKASQVVIEKQYATPTPAGTVAEGHISIKGERFAYREVSWDEETEKAANLAANKGAGEFDMAAVADWIGELDTGEFDMDLTMFDVGELAALITPHGSSCSDGGDDESVPEPPAEPTAVLGDVWQLGRHRLMCGDSRNVQAIDELLAGAKAQMVYTDPPYGIDVRTNWNADDLKLSGVHSTNIITQHRKIEGDDAPFDPSFFLEYFSACPEMFIWGGDYFAKYLPDGGAYIVWDKRTKQDGTSLDVFMGSDFELCWSKAKHRRLMVRILWSGLCQGPKEGKRVHPSQKPVALTEWFFERWGKKGDVVVDLYGGSGSTLLACEKQDRTCLMMEIDPGYVDVIIARWEKLIGQKAKLLTGSAAEQSKVLNA